MSIDPSSTPVDSVSRRSIFTSCNTFSSVPTKYRHLVAKKELEWNQSMVTGIGVTFSLMYSLLIIFSDSQKSNWQPWVGSRLIVILCTSVGVFFARRKQSSITTTNLVTFALAILYPAAYVWTSNLGLPMRTTWITVFPAFILIASIRNILNASSTYFSIISVALYTFAQSINPIWVVGDVVFGFTVLLSGFALKRMWTRSIVATLEYEDLRRQQLEHEIKIFEVLEVFIPRAIRSKVRNGIQKGNINTKLIDLFGKTDPVNVGVVYSDFRNYSKRSGNIDFIENELIASSRPIIEQAETLGGFVQNRGDSILAYFMDEDPWSNLKHALALAAYGINAELDRIQKTSTEIKIDRSFIVTSGEVISANLGSNSRKELTITGKPVNLAQRLDEITKTDSIRDELKSGQFILIDFNTAKSIKNSFPELKLRELDLAVHGVNVRTYEEERRVYLLHYKEVISWNENRTTDEVKEAA